MLSYWHVAKGSYQPRQFLLMANPCSHYQPVTANIRLFTIDWVPGAKSEKNIQADSPFLQIDTNFPDTIDNWED